MSILSELADLPGVICAGEYSFRGDRFTYKGQMNDDMARQASIMCRATTMSMHMQAGIMNNFCERCGLFPSRGWVVRGAQITVCVVANVFCFLNEADGSMNQVLNMMNEKVPHDTDELV